MLQVDHEDKIDSWFIPEIHIRPLTRSGASSFGQLRSSGPAYERARSGQTTAGHEAMLRARGDLNFPDAGATRCRWVGLNAV
jgi:hypothetical protein